MYKKNKQNGLISILLLLIIGSALMGIVYTSHSNIKTIQNDTILTNAITQSQIKSWTGNEITKQFFEQLSSEDLKSLKNISLPSKINIHSKLENDISIDLTGFLSGSDSVNIPKIKSICKETDDAKAALLNILTFEITGIHERSTNVIKNVYCIGEGNEGGVVVGGQTFEEAALIRGNVTLSGNMTLTGAANSMIVIDGNLTTSGSPNLNNAKLHVKGKVDWSASTGADTLFADDDIILKNSAKFNNLLSLKNINLFASSAGSHNLVKANGKIIVPSGSASFEELVAIEGIEMNSNCGNGTSNTRKIRTDGYLLLNNSCPLDEVVAKGEITAKNIGKINKIKTNKSFIMNNNLSDSANISLIQAEENILIEGGGTYNNIFAKKDIILNKGNGSRKISNGLSGRDFLVNSESSSVSNVSAVRDFIIDGRVSGYSGAMGTFNNIKEVGRDFLIYSELSNGCISGTQVGRNLEINNLSNFYSPICTGIFSNLNIGNNALLDGNVNAWPSAYSYLNIKNNLITSRELWGGGFNNIKIGNSIIDNVFVYWRQERSGTYKNNKTLASSVNYVLTKKSDLIVNNPLITINENHPDISFNKITDSIIPIAEKNYIFPEVDANKYRNQANYIFTYEDNKIRVTTQKLKEFVDGKKYYYISQPTIWWPLPILYRSNMLCPTETFNSTECKPIASRLSEGSYGLYEFTAITYSQNTWYIKSNGTSAIGSLYQFAPGIYFFEGNIDMNNLNFPGSIYTTENYSDLGTGETTLNSANYLSYETLCENTYFPYTPLNLCNLEKKEKTGISEGNISILAGSIKDGKYIGGDINLANANKYNGSIIAGNNLGNSNGGASGGNGDGEINGVIYSGNQLKTNYNNFGGSWKINLNLGIPKFEPRNIPILTSQGTINNTDTITMKKIVKLRWTKYQ